MLFRSLLWDRERQEGVLLIRWASLEDWKAIPEAEVDGVQGRFEAAARRALGLGEGGANPFPLLSSGGLQPLGRT